jgi:hypothetical protein
MRPIASVVRPQDPDKHHPEDLVVDQQLGVVTGSFPNYAVAVIS